MFDARRDALALKSIHIGGGQHAREMRILCEAFKALIYKSVWHRQHKLGAAYSSSKWGLDGYEVRK